MIRALIKTRARRLREDRVLRTGKERSAGRLAGTQDVIVWLQVITLHIVEVSFLSSSSHFFIYIRWRGNERGFNVIKVCCVKERLHDFKDNWSGHVRQGLPCEA